MVFQNATDPQRLLTLYFFNQYGQSFKDFPKEGLLTPELLSPQYVPESRANEIVGITVSFTSVAVLVVSMRLYVTAFWPNVRFGREDCFFILAAFILLAFAVIIVLDVYYGGLGHHIYDLRPSELSWAYKVSVAMFEMYIWATLFTKFSNFIFLLKIAPKNLVWTRRVIKGWIWFGTLEAITSSLLYLFPCRPVSAVWSVDERLGHPNCINMQAVALSTNIMFVATDFWNLLLPLAIIPALNLPRRTTIAVCALWLLGLAACLTCTFKVKYFARLYLTFDQSWVSIDVIKWSILELTISLITVTLPTIDMLLVKLIPNSVRERLAQLDMQHESQSKTLGSSYFQSFDRTVDQEKLDFVQELDPRTKQDKIAHLQSYAVAMKDRDGGLKMQTPQQRLEEDRIVTDAYEEYLRHEQEKEMKQAKTAKGKRLSLQEFTMRSLSRASPQSRTGTFGNEDARTQSMSRMLGSNRTHQTGADERSRSTSNLQSHPSAHGATFGSGRGYGPDIGYGPGISSDEIYSQTGSDSRGDYNGNDDYSDVTATTPRVRSMASDTLSESSPSQMDVVGRSFLNI